MEEDPEKECKVMTLIVKNNVNKEWNERKSIYETLKSCKERTRPMDEGGRKRVPRRQA